MPREDTQFSSTNQPPAYKKSRKGSLNLKTIIRNILAQELTDKDGNKVTNAYLMNKAIVNKAKTGDVSAFKALSERLEGMPEQSIKQENIHSFTKMPTIKKDGKEINIDIG